MTTEPQASRSESTPVLSRPSPRFHRLARAALICYWLVLFAGTHMRLPPEALPPNSDKTAHLVGYAGLAFLLGLWMSLRKTMSAGRYALVLAIAAGYGALDELTQIPVGRTADVWDWVADCIGAVLGLTVLLIVSKFVARLWTPSDLRTQVTANRSS